MGKHRRESIKYLKLRDASGIEHIINQLGRERGKSSAKKVFQVLENWLTREWILSYNESSERDYYDYIRHIDGWFMTLDGEMVDFQIKSSWKAAQEHLKEYPDIPVIVVRSGVSLDDLDQQMRKLFKDKLSYIG